MRHMQNVNTHTLFAQNRLLQARLIIHSPVVFREQMPCIIANYYYVNAHQYGAFLETHFIGDPERESNSGPFDLKVPALPSELPCFS